MKRRLAAILAADVVGFTALMARDEEGTMKALRDHRARVFDLITQDIVTVFSKVRQLFVAGHEHHAGDAAKSRGARNLLRGNARKAEHAWMVRIGQGALSDHAR